MARDRALDITPALYEYLVAHGEPVDPVYLAIRRDTDAKAADRAGMQIGPEQFTFLRLLVQIVGVELAVEVGTFTGSSSTAIAGGLAPGGRLVCCDVSEEWTDIARQHWAAAGVADRIDLRLAPAIETLAALPTDPPVDFAFVDADKESYLDYYEALVPRLRPGGVLVADNVLWSGRVVDEAEQDASTEAIRRFNEDVAGDSRVTKVMLPVGDGITICRKLRAGGRAGRATRGAGAGSASSERRASRPGHQGRRSRVRKLRAKGEEAGTLRRRSRVLQV